MKNKLPKILALVFLLFVSDETLADITQSITVQGKIVKMDDSNVTVKDEKGLMIVPRSSLSAKEAVIGYWVRVSLEFPVFYRLNPKKFK